MERFGPYDLVERIGVGSLGEVFRAVHRATGAVVALKRLSQRASDTYEVTEALEAEAKLTRALDHPGIAKLVDVGVVDDIHYIAHAFIPGTDLRSFQRAAGEVPLDVAIHIVLRVAEALAYAHGRASLAGAPLKLVHRDVTPTNVLVGSNGEVKLLDFGIARAEGQAIRTKVGEVKGTVGYMSPEQIAGQIVDGRSDVYSLGACFWELLTGRRLFEGTRPKDVMQRTLAGEIPRPSAHRTLPPELERVVLKSLARSPTERYASADELHAELSELARATSLLADTTRVAKFVRSVFPESAVSDRLALEGSSVESTRAPHGGDAAMSPSSSRGQRGKEQQDMAESKGGSDLDVFEGLAKKAARPAGNLAPPPPPSAPPRKATLVGMAVPDALKPPSISPVIPPAAPTLQGLPPSLPPPSIPPKPGDSPSKPPGPPPSRASGMLPQVSAPPKPGEAPPSPASTSGSLPPPMPPSKSTALLPAPLPPPSAAPKMTPLPPPTITPLPPPPPTMASPSGAPAVLPPPAAPSIASALGVEKKAKKDKSVDMDWDDEEESTHVYDKESAAPVPTGPRPAAGTPAAPRVSAAAALLAASGKTAPMQTVQIPASAATPTPISPAAQALPMSGANEPTAVRPRPLSAPPTSSGSKTGVILGGLALVVVLALAVFTLLPKKGVFKIDVKTKAGGPIAKAEIYIDGRKYCDTAPCVVPELDPGPKTIKIIAPDYPPTDPVTETVEAGKEKVVSLTLGEGTASPAGTTQVASSNTGGTGIRVQGNQPGVHVWVDGVDKGALPAELRDLAPGSHKIKLDGGEHYERQEMNVDVVAGEIKDIGEKKLKVVKGQVTLELVTSGATVELVRNAGAKKIEKKLPESLWKSPPVRVDIDPSENWQLVATKKGFDDFKQDLGFDDGMAEKTIKIELLEQGKPAPVVANNTPTPGPISHETPTPREPKEPKGNEQASGTGTLNINSIPVSKVLLDGKPLGDTPKIGISVSAGSHNVTFISAELGQKSVSVNVRAGETKTAAVKFKAPE